jgi:aldehyde dehydrogenase (NAD+)
MVTEHEASIITALKEDLGRHPFESLTTDLVSVKQCILEHIEHLEEWAADEIPNTGLVFSL